jgi:hypothetical protein
MSTDFLGPTAAMMVPTRASISVPAGGDSTTTPLLDATASITSWYVQ